MMSSALDPMFAYHWIDIDVEVEHNEAQTSQAQYTIKWKIEELVVKEKALARRTASSRVIAEAAVSSPLFNKQNKQTNKQSYGVVFHHTDLLLSVN